MSSGTFVCLLRGINVGGANRLKMADFRTFLEALGFSGVRTYIQSGNAVFGAPGATTEIAKRIEAEFPARLGLSPRVMVLGGQALLDAIHDNPYTEQAADDPKKVHASFLDADPLPEDLARLGEIESKRDEWTRDGRVVYFHLPDGLGRSKLAAAAERVLRVPMTSRNWRSVEAIAALLET